LWWHYPIESQTITARRDGALGGARARGMSYCSCSASAASLCFRTRYFNWCGRFTLPFIPIMDLTNFGDEASARQIRAQPSDDVCSSARRNDAWLHVRQPHGMAHNSGSAGARCGSQRLSWDNFSRLHVRPCQNMPMDTPHRPLHRVHSGIFAEFVAVTSEPTSDLRIRAGISA
jgi:hypothetical protein